MQRVFRYGWPSGPDHRVVIHPDRTKQVLVVTTLLLFFLLSGWLLTLGGTRAVLAGFVGAATTGIFGGLGVARLVDRKPALVLDRDGLHDNASAVGVGLVRWSEMARVRTTGRTLERILVIDVHDPEALLARLGPAKRWAVRTNMRFHGMTVAIPQNALPLPVESVIAEMRTFLPDR